MNKNGNGRWNWMTMWYSTKAQDYIKILHDVREQPMIKLLIQSREVESGLTTSQSATVTSSLVLAARECAMLQPANKRWNNWIPAVWRNKRSNQQNKECESKKVSYVRLLESDNFKMLAILQQIAINDTTYAVKEWHQWIPVPWHYHLPTASTDCINYLFLLQTCKGDLKYLMWLREVTTDAFREAHEAAIAASFVCVVSISEVLRKHESGVRSKPWKWITSIWSGTSKKCLATGPRTRRYLHMMEHDRCRNPAIAKLIELSDELQSATQTAAVVAVVGCLSAASDVSTFSDIATASALCIVTTVGFAVDTAFWMSYTPNVDMNDNWMTGVLSIPCYEHFTYVERCGCLKHGVELTDTRINNFLQGNVEPYQYPEDTSTDMAMRVADGAALIASAVAPHFQRWNTALRIIGQISLFKQLAPYMLGYIALSSDVGEALADLASLMSVSQSGPQSNTQLIIGLYYLLVYRRGERGNHPTCALSEHSESSPGVVKENASESDLFPIRKYACLVKFVYQETAADVQRLAAQQGFTLLAYEPLVNARHPPYCLFQDDTSKEIIIAVRGTKHLSDILIDICAKPAVLKTPNNSYKVHRGMLRSALWIAVKIWHPLLVLASKGYEFKIVGHSLGAGIGALLATILREFEIIPRLECVGFAMPSCCERSLAEKAEAYCISAVNGDDLVPRVRSTSLHNLMTAVADPVLQDRSEKDLSGDTSAVLGRLATIWAPRVRKQSAKPKKNAPASTKENLKDNYLRSLGGSTEDTFVNVVVVFERQDYGLEELSIEVRPTAPLSIVRAQAAAAASMAAASNANIFIDNHLITESDVTRRIDEFFPRYMTTRNCSVYMTRKIEECSASELLVLQFANPGESPESIGLLQLDFNVSTVKAIVAALAAKSGRINPTAIEVWSVSPDGVQNRIPVGVSGEGWNQTLRSLNLKSGDILLGRDSWGARLLNKQTSDAPLGNILSNCGSNTSLRDTTTDSTGELAAGDDLIEFWPPGKIIHLYFVCGVVKAALLRPWARVLERIELSSKMGDDHRMDSLMRSLRSLTRCRERNHPIPEWEPFGAAMQCRCCRTNFAWESTSSTAASQLRSRAHCHHCGKIVCTECRQNKLSSDASPSPAPICDTCFFNVT